MSAQLKARSYPWVVLLAAVYSTFVGVEHVMAQTTVSPLSQGAVGVGSYATISQFKDLQVRAEDRVLLDRTLGEGLSGVNVFAGQWQLVDGVLQQSALDAKGMNVFTGDTNWTDYIVTVKARKIAGKEGFSLGFRARDDRNFACLNVGGWNNTKAQFGVTINGTFAEVGDATTMKVEEDRWYDVKVDVHGDEATGFVDGRKVAKATLLAPPSKPAANPTRNNPRSGAAPGPSRNAGSPTLTATASPEPSSLGNKLILVSATALITGLVAAGVMWVRNQLGAVSPSRA
jgi:hypothetical protein